MMLWCSGCGREEDAPFDEGDQCECGGRFVDESRKLFQPEEGGARVCRTCGGKGCKWGWKKGGHSTVRKCPACNGTGKEESDGV